MGKFERQHIKELKEEGTVFGYVSEQEVIADKYQDNKDMILLMFKDARGLASEEEKIMCIIDHMLAYNGVNHISIGDIREAAEEILWTIYHSHSNIKL